MFLLDTDVVSMLSPARIGSHRAFVDWLRAAEAKSDIALSAITIHELETGVSLLEAKGAVAKAAVLRSWLAGLANSFADRIVPFDAEIARLSGELEARAMNTGHAPGAADAIVAGTAKFLGATLVTRNARHFRAFAIELLDPASFA